MVYNLTSGTSRCSVVLFAVKFGFPQPWAPRWTKACHRQNDAFELCDEIGLETLEVPTKRRVREAPQADGGVGGVS